MSNVPSPEIPSNPIRFADGVLLPYDPNSLTADPQSLWFSVERAQKWNAYNILGLTVECHQTGQPFIEPAPFESIPEKIVEADNQRGGTDRYTAGRNIESLSVFLGVGRKKLVTELGNKAVLDVGSGDGLVADDLRRYGKARVTELDFSAAAFLDVGPILNNRGRRIVGDGTQLPFDAGAFDGVVSMFSTFVHADTIRPRLQGLTEAVRVTKPGGRLFIAPIFGNMMLRQNRWDRIVKNRVHLGQDVSKEDVLMFKRGEQQQSAIDYALYGLMNRLMQDRTIDVTPILKLEPHDGYNKDIISAIIDVNEPLSTDKAEALIEEQAATFSR